MSKRFFKVRYTWKPAEHGFSVPADKVETGSTVTTGETKASVGATFQRKHPHVRVESVSIVR